MSKLGGLPVVLFRESLGDVLRAERNRQGMTLRQLSGESRISLGYISEIERGHKEASSELLSALCHALDLRLSEVLRQVSDTVAAEERALEREVTPIPVPVARPTGDVVASAA